MSQYDRMLKETSGCWRGHSETQVKWSIWTDPKVWNISGSVTTNSLRCPRTRTLDASSRSWQALLMPRQVMLDTGKANGKARLDGRWDGSCYPNFKGVESQPRRPDWL